MSTFDCQELVVNLALYKRIGLYHIFDTDSPKILRYHVYRLALVIFSATTLCITVFGVLGCFTNAEDIVDDINNSFETACAVTYILLSALKINICIYNANRIWNLLCKSCVHFYTSAQCSRHIGVLRSYRDISIKNTNVMFKIYVTTAVIMLLCSTLFSTVYRYTTPLIDAEKRRYENIFNLQYPVTINTYNEYYYVFYVFELIALLYISYTTIIIDILLISMSYDVIANYKVLARAFENIGHGEERLNEVKKHYTEYYNDIKSVIVDQQKLFLKCKEYYSVMWPITICIVVVTSISIILIAYSIILVYVRSESPISIVSKIKLVCPFLCLTAELYIYCYLLDQINTKRESVTFGMYSCNWTMMDLKFKKLLLIAMRMYNANRSIIKVTPKKIVNLMFFTNVIITCYNIVSVMLKTQFKNDILD